MENRNRESSRTRRYVTPAYEKLSFTDDFMFCKVLTEHEDLCCELAELFTGRKARKIKGLSAQMTAKMLQSGKGVRFDVWFEGDDSVYDFEMQTTVKPNLPKRMRYYQAQLDSRHLRPGQDYTELPCCYIVFICLEDPFGANACRYTFRNACKEFPELVLGDGAERIIINASGVPDQASKELRPFLDYLKGKGASDDLTNRIENAVQDARDDEEGRTIYMTLEEKYAESRAEGRAEGRAEARAEMQEQINEKDRIIAQLKAENQRLKSGSVSK